jgi:hypothetical protein
MHSIALFGPVLGAAILIWAVQLPPRTGRRAAVLIRIRNGAKLFALLVAFAPLIVMFPAVAHGQAASPDPQRQSLGSLNTTGDVFVNESKVPSETTLFAGDVVRTGETGTAILTTSGNNTFEIARQSQVDFTGETRYFAELKAGTVAVKSMGGAGGAVMRAGNFVVVPNNRTERTVVNITKMPDGSYLLSCAEGNLGVVPLQQAQGLFLQAGQSARISVQGELAAVETPPSGPAHAGRNNKTWIYLGLAGAGVAAGVAAALATRGPISPSAP